MITDERKTEILAMLRHEGQQHAEQEMRERWQAQQTRQDTAQVSRTNIDIA
jgi:hypothetical protein